MPEVLRAGELAATFEPGASMVCSSLTHAGAELLGQRGGLGAYVEQGKTLGIPLLHPWANRLHGWSYGEVELDRDSPSIRSEENGLPIHGLVHGRGRFEVVASGASALRAQLDFGAQSQWLAQFPFPHVLEVAVELSPAALTHTTTLTATGVVPVPVSFGWHPYLVLPGVPRGAWGVPTGLDEPSDATSFAIEGGGRRLSIEFLDGYTVAHLFAPEAEELVAFEPMTAPVDALRTGEGLRYVAPGASFSASFRIAVERVGDAP